MYLPIRKLLREKEAPVQWAGEFDFSAWDFPDFEVPEPVAVSLLATQQGGAVHISLSLNARITAHCARCLDALGQSYKLQKNHTLRQADLDDPDAEMPFTPDGRLDVEELAYQELLLEVPPVLLCSQNCAGLCARCGMPKAQCTCPPEDTADPRLQVLKQLLEPDEE